MASVIDCDRANNGTEFVDLAITDFTTSGMSSLGNDATAAKNRRESEFVMRCRLVQEQDIYLYISNTHVPGIIFIHTFSHLTPAHACRGLPGRRS